MEGVVHLGPLLLIIDDKLPVETVTCDVERKYTVKPYICQRRTIAVALVCPFNTMVWEDLFLRKVDNSLCMCRQQLYHDGWDTGKEVY